MNQAVLRCALICWWFSTCAFAQTPNEGAARAAPEAPAGIESAKLELQLGAVDLALFNAEARLAEGRWDDAIAMAWVGLEQAEVLPQSQVRSSRIATLMQVIIDARVEKRLAESRPKETVMTAAAQAPTTMAASRTATGLSNEQPPTLPTPLAEALSRMGEDPDLPERIMAYPEDWKERTNRTKPERVGIMFEGETFQDARGNAVQTIVYDVRSLILPTPNFQFVPFQDLHGATQTAADRDALRRGSDIFNGYADDLAAGSDLLGDFGGVGNWPASFKDEGRELAELIRVIEEITTP